MNSAGRVASWARVTPRKIHIALPLLLMAVLYWLSSLPGTPLPDDPVLYGLLYWVPPTVQNALHVPAYAVLALSWRWALGAWLRGHNADTLYACAIALAYGFFDEWHQSFVPGRYASLIDVVLNVTGVALGIWLAVWMGSRAITIKPQD